MIWKDKEILGQLKNIERKLDMLITMKKNEKINQINKKIGGKKDV